jgi:aerobic carbon-monoxide dehydrogenase medium subunit
MYPARFEYHAPSTVDEALGLLERYGDEGKVPAGGQSLIPLMKLRFASPRALVDLNRIQGLDSIAESDGYLTIGALVRHKDCERSEALRGRYGALGDAPPQISDPIVRNLGTVAGSLAHADPHGDWGSALLAVRAHVEAVGPVCGMTVSLAETAEQTVHEGVTLAFCSAHCRARFEADPARYSGLRAS